MPYKSDAQRRFFHAAEARGEMPHETVHEWDKASKGKKLPEKAKQSKEWKKNNEEMHHMMGGAMMHKCIDRITKK